MPVEGEADLSQWWHQFGDAELQSLIGRALASNLDLLTASSRVREARQQEIIAGGVALPQVGAAGFAGGLHSGSNSAVPLNGFSVGFDASWEIDVFGGGRRGIEAAQAGTEAAIWRMRDGEMALTAEIATDYIRLRSTQQRIAILQAETQAQQDLLHVMQARAGAGFVTQLEVNQQSSLADSTAAQVPELEANVRALEHAIAVLLAEQPGALVAELDKKGTIPDIPVTLPIGLPSDLLRRRPDVRAAERELAAATAKVGVAVSHLYPKFNLIGATGLAGGSIGTLAPGASLAEFGLGSISWPIFNWGQSQANVHAKNEEAKQAYNTYQKTVLGAVQDVEDALSRYVGEQQRLLTLQRAEASAKASTAIATQQFKVGTVTYVDVLVAEVNELSVRDKLAQNQEMLAADLISLYKALGGGWTADGGPGTLASRENPMTAATRLLEKHSPTARDGLSSDRIIAAVPEIAVQAAHNIGVNPFQSQSDRGKADETSAVNGPDRPGFQLQLGAWRSEAAARAGWEDAIRKARTLLRGLVPQIVPADLPQKGRYYRLRTDPTSADSIKLCQALIGQGVACILVRG